MFEKIVEKFNAPGAALFALVVLFTFGLTAASAAGVTVFVTPHAPVVTIKAHPRHVKVGQSSTVIWSAQFATHGCVQSGEWSGANEGVGGTYQTGPLTEGEHTYTLLCSGDQNRQGSGSVTVTAGSREDKKDSNEDRDSNKKPKGQKPVCEYMRPPEGCTWVGMKPFPNCGAAHLECTGGSTQ
jgi:hypothetical protein